MARPHQPTLEFPQHLEVLYTRFPFERSLAEDPISAIRPLIRDRRSGEIVGIYAATLAIGNTTAIRGAIGRLADAAHGDLRAFVTQLSPKERQEALREFRHRWIRGDQMAYLGSQLAGLYDRYDSLETLFLEGMADGGFALGLDRLARGLRGDRRAPPGYRALFPSPVDRPRSPCKRMTLYLRWMVRSAYPDLGLWRRVPTGELRIPLDQHVFWIAYHLGLTQRKTRSWATVEEVTERLRRIDPIDPVKYDFVLCHTGISGDCPKHRDLTVCGPCVVRPDCLMWRGRSVAA
ncbi:MAG: TIGR02757 family protein [Thermoplasmata archaeon]